MTELPEIEDVLFEVKGPVIEQSCPGSCDFLQHSHGVIHVGAHIGQERDRYAAMGLPVVWIEAVPGLFRVLQDRIRSCPDQRALCCLVTDVEGEERDLLIANNSESTSLFPLALHRHVWPQVDLVARMRMKTRTLASIIAEHRIDLVQHDTLILDVQGAELLVLQGAGELVRQFRWIRAEVCDFESYRGGCLLADLDDYLLARGFDRHALYPWKVALGADYYEALYRRV